MTYYHLHRLFFITLLLVPLLTSLGCGGSGKSNKTPPEKNAAPTVDAGKDQEVAAQTSVTLTSTTSDIDGEVTQYLWTQRQGPQIDLVDAQKAKAKFISPKLSEKTTFSFLLLVTDNDGATATDSVDITVLPHHDIPSADAGPDQTVEGSKHVTLTGTTDTEEESISQYTWIQESGIKVTLNNANNKTANFVAPEVSQKETLVFTFLLTDINQNTASDTVTITLTSSPSKQKPLASAGDDITVGIGTPVTLNAENSSSIPGTTITHYLWHEGETLLGSNVYLTKSDFTVGTHRITLTITDSNGLEDIDELIVTVLDNNSTTWLPDNNVLGFEILQHAAYINDRTCDLLSANERNIALLQQRIALNAQTTSDKTAQLATKNLEAAHKRIEINETTELYNINKNLLDNFNLNLEVNDHVKEDAYAAYQQCKEDNGSDACTTEREDYQTKRDAARNFRQNTVQPQERKLNEIHRELLEQQDSLTDIEDEIAKLQQFLANAKQDKDDLNIAENDYVQAIHSRGDSLNISLHGLAQDLASMNPSLIDMGIYLRPATKHSTGLGPSLGILNFGGNTAVPYYGLQFSGWEVDKVIDPRYDTGFPGWESIWSPDSEPMDNNQAYLNLINSGHSIQLELDRRNSCMIQNAQNDASSEMQVSILHVLNESIELKNTYKMLVEPSTLINVIRSRANRFGYIDIESLLSIGNTEDHGLYLETLSIVDDNEQQTIQQKIKHDFIFRLIRTIALPVAASHNVVASHNKDCQSSLACSFEGWWLDTESSPILTGEIIQDLLAKSPDEIEYTLSGKIYLNEYASRTVSKPQSQQ